MFYDRRYMRELKAAGLQHFQEGDKDSINPHLPWGEQADLLPYDSKYEFPREQLTLGNELGSGAFGVVLKAIAKKILPNEDESTVAVKMVKRNYDNEVGFLAKKWFAILINHLCRTRTDKGDASTCYGIKNHDSHRTSRQCFELTWSRHKKYCQT